MTVLLTFVFWTWYSSVDWVAWAPVKDAIQPLIDFMQPFMNFYSDIYLQFSNGITGNNAWYTNGK